MKTLLLGLAGVGCFFIGGMAWAQPTPWPGDPFCYNSACGSSCSGTGYANCGTPQCVPFTGQDPVYGNPCTMDPMCGWLGDCPMPTCVRTSTPFYYPMCVPSTSSTACNRTKCNLVGCGQTYMLDCNFIPGNECGPGGYYVCAVSSMYTECDGPDTVCP